ncbi:UNKNOWN [Stylonychia lemnae]|uniref:Uncharacterized protein n=1 Tax=Stylonychia lemnae TaxID=5949 RepID=A0A078BBU6_STYLE|nr:UNKNOWN [Stylonychia lemnae]|eukprot:CDW91681.1 UNKNOWN [Stylonychia lemnae]
MGNSSVCIKQQIKPNSNNANMQLGISGIDQLSGSQRRTRSKKQSKDFIESQMNQEFLNQNENININILPLHQEKDSGTQRNHDASTKMTQNNDEIASQSNIKQGSSSRESGHSKLMMQSSTPKSLSIDKNTLQPDKLSSRKGDSYMSNRFLVPESINSAEIHESMLISDINMDISTSQRDNYNFIGYSQNNQQHFIADQDSLTKSYNQKVKEDTNYLAKQKMIYDNERIDNHSYDNQDENNKTSRKNSADNLYDLELRQSYAQLIEQQSSQYSQSKQKHKLSDQLDSFEPSEFVPIEYEDSDNEILNISVIELNDPQLIEDIVKKVNSIGGIRKIYYLFKHQRRELLQAKNNGEFDEEYIEMCELYLSEIEGQRQKNLNYVLRKLGNISKIQYSKNLNKIDKELQTLLGLNRRVKMPKNYDVEQAKELKLKMQENVLKLWKMHKNLLSDKLDMEKLLSILECYAEDLLYFEYDVEIEQLEKLIHRHQQLNTSRLISDSLSDSGNRLSVSYLLQHSDTLNSVGKMSLKMAVRMSIFTIHEEEVNEDDDYE